MHKKDILKYVMILIVIVIFWCLGNEHLHPKNNSFWDPLLLFFPFTNNKRSPNTTCAKIIMFILSVFMAALIFL